MTKSSFWCCRLLLLVFATAGHVSFARELRQNVPQADVEVDGASRDWNLEISNVLLSRKLPISSKERCRGWMTNVESGNIKGFQNTPLQCYSTIKKYIEKGQYLPAFPTDDRSTRSDLPCSNCSVPEMGDQTPIHDHVVEEDQLERLVDTIHMVDLSVSTTEMWKYISTMTPDGYSDAIMFDIDETLLSTAKIQAMFKYGTVPFNATLYNSQQDTLILPALPPSLELYLKLKAARWKLILVTSRKDTSRAHTEENLKAIGYTSWDELILKTDEYNGLTAAVYKSMVRVKLEKEKGYSFKSCAGDQVSDCTGEATGGRTWKFPNPMYYAA